MSEPGEAARYEQLSDRVFALYEQERYAAALAALAEQSGSLPTYRSDIAHTAACLHARAGDPATALRVLQEAADHGAWWHPRILDDEDLAGLTELPGFAELVAEATARSAAAQAAARARPPAVVLSEPASAARGLVVVLHGAGQDAGGAASRCSAAVDHGYHLVAVDSSQLSTPTYRTWPDQEAAADDVAAALVTLPAPVRELPVVAAGFSAGARAATLWALSATPVPVAGLIAVAPAIWADQTAAATHHPRGVVLIGAEDDLLPTTREAVATLPAVRLEVVDGLGHDYPDDFDAWLPAALDEVLAGAAGGTPHP